MKRPIFAVMCSLFFFVSHLEAASKFTQRRFSPGHRTGPYTMRRLSDMKYLFKEDPNGWLDLSAVFGTFKEVHRAFKLSKNKRLTVQWHSSVDMLYLHCSIPEVSTMVNPDLHAITADVVHSDLLRMIRKMSLEEIIKHFDD